MTSSLRPLCVLFLAGLLAACKTTSSLGDLPRAPSASIDQLLQQATTAEPEEAAVLRLAAADQAYKQNNIERAAQILGQLPQSSLKPAQQVFASTLKAQLELVRNNPKAALQAFDNPNFQRLGEMPVELQARAGQVKAKALAGEGQILAAARERVFVAPLLNPEANKINQDAIWALVSSLPAEQMQATNNEGDLNGWLELARATKTASNLQQQQAAIDSWMAANPDHPAAKQLPESLQKLKSLTAQPLNKVALLLPQQGQLANVAKALQDGFLAAHYQAQQQGQVQLAISLYDSTQVTSLDDFYRQAQAEGVQLVVGPLDKELVKQLSRRPQLPITTLALNYSDASENPPQLFQFGLSAEDEAREVANRAWSDGMRRAIALVPRGEWGDRVLTAFSRNWEAMGGTLIAAERIDKPVELAGQIADLLQLRQSESRAQRVQGVLDGAIDTQPSRRQDVDFLFLASTPQQARQVKPTLAFQYAGDLPVYGTSNLNSGISNPNQDQDLNGIRLCETPWLLEPNNALRQQIVSQWPQAAGSLGRLYAMGADAYQLAPRLQELKAVPNLELDGLTGTLRMNAKQRIERRLPWAEFRDGQLLPLGNPGI